MTPWVAAGPLPASVATRYPHGYAVVDVETSGLDARENRVLQVAVRQMRSDGALEASWSTLLDPGCDPGPVEIHGLTRAKLAGAPHFDQVCAHLVAMLDGRVFVAHNASFDWRFLSAETNRCNTVINAQGRLCTIAMTRRLDIPTTSLRLEAVAQYWGVSQNAAHDAADDTRVTVEILRHSLVVADRLNLHLPITVADRGRSRTAYPPRAPRTPCPWRYPGRLGGDRVLRKGMKVAFTGPTEQPRETLTWLATRAGLDVMNSVSSRTSLLVNNRVGPQTEKAAAARAHQTAVVDEATFAHMLDTVRAGDPKIAPARPGPGASRSGPTSGKNTTAPATGPLTGRRVLVLGGPHTRAAYLRSRIADMGGQAAANLTMSVTEVVALDGYETDPRWRRARSLSLPVLSPDTLSPISLVPEPTTVPAASPPTPQDAPLGTPPAHRNRPPVAAAVLGRGAVIDLPDGHRWSVDVSWSSATRSAQDIVVDVVAFVVDADEQVSADNDFCFYNQPHHPTGAVTLDLDVPSEAIVGLDLDLLPYSAECVIVAAAIDGTATFGDLGPIELIFRDTDGTPVARATLDAARRERTMLLCSVYIRAGRWRIRSVGQGYTEGLAHLAVLHGVDVQD